LGTGSKYYFIFGFPEFIVQVWQNKFKQKVSYYETKPLPSQHTSTDINLFHHDVARLKVGDLLH
jgi:hypothetical protein